MQEAEIINFEKSRVNVNSLDWWIHFAVDNNIKSVLLNYAALGYTDVAVDPATLKDKISEIAKTDPKRAASIINVPIVRYTNNWTTDAIADYATDIKPTQPSASKINWANVGTAVLGVGSILVGLFSGGTVPGQLPQNNPAPAADNTDTILGLQRTTFYITAGITLVLIALIFYIATKK